MKKSRSALALYEGNRFGSENRSLSRASVFVPNFPSLNDCLLCRGEANRLEIHSFLFVGEGMMRFSLVTEKLGSASHG